MLFPELLLIGYTLNIVTLEEHLKKKKLRFSKNKIKKWLLSNLGHYNFFHSACRLLIF